MKKKIKSNRKKKTSIKHLIFSIKEILLRNFPGDPWLRSCTSTARGLGLILVKELRSHMLCVATKTIIFFLILLIFFLFSLWIYIFLICWKKPFKMPFTSSYCLLLPLFFFIVKTLQLVYHILFLLSLTFNTTPHLVKPTFENFVNHFTSSQKGLWGIY